MKRLSLAFSIATLAACSPKVTTPTRTKPPEILPTCSSQFVEDYDRLKTLLAKMPKEQFVTDTQYREACAQFDERHGGSAICTRSPKTLQPLNRNDFINACADARLGAHLYRRSLDAYFLVVDDGKLNDLIGIDGAQMFTGCRVESDGLFSAGDVIRFQKATVTRFRATFEGDLAGRAVKFICVTRDPDSDVLAELEQNFTGVMERNDPPAPNDRNNE